MYDLEFQTKIFTACMMEWCRTENGKWTNICNSNRFDWRSCWNTKMSNFHSNEWYFSHIKQYTHTYTHTHTSRHITESKTKTKTNKQHLPSTHLDLNRKPSHQVCTCAFVTTTERCDCHCVYIYWTGPVIIVLRKLCVCVLSSSKKFAQIQEYKWSSETFDIFLRLHNLEIVSWNGLQRTRYPELECK